MATTGPFAGKTNMKERPCFRAHGVAVRKQVLKQDSPDRSIFRGFREDPFKVVNKFKHSTGSISGAHKRRWDLI